tara:strand:- start:1484 stop:1672 length:189 start_codon:yes stop_codon:yes gene_type:complete
VNKYIVKKRWEGGAVTYLSARLWSTTKVEMAYQFTVDEIIHYWGFIKPRKSRMPILIQVRER